MKEFGRNLMSLLLRTIIITLVWYSGAALAQNRGFSYGPDLLNARVAPQSDTLADGRALVFGGFGTDYLALSTAEVWSPGTNTFSLLTMQYPHARGALARLPDGRYLLAGSSPDGDSGDPLNTAEIYNPQDDSFTATGNLNYGRGGCNAAVLTGGNYAGKVLVVGGLVKAGADQSSSTYGELFDPALGKFTVTGALNVPRSTPVVLPTNDGKAMVIGGYAPTGGPTQIETVELYNPDTNQFTVLQEYLIPGETGWMAGAAHLRFPIENQKLADGRFFLIMAKYLGPFAWQYAYYTVDPATKTIARFDTKPQLPDTLTSGLYFFPMVDNANGEVYQLATVNSGGLVVSPVKIRLLTVDLASGDRTNTAYAFTLPTNWCPWYGGLTLLQDGRLFNMGGFSELYFIYGTAIKQTLFISPSLVPQGLSSPAMGLLLN